MQSFIFDLFIILSYPTAIITLLIMLLSGCLFFRRKNQKKVLHLNRYLLLYPFMIFIMYLILIVNSLIIYKTEYVGSYTEPVQLFVIVLVNLGNWLSIVFTWVWCNKRYVVYEDKFVHYRCFFGKREVYFKDIDPKKSKYAFVEPKSDRGFADEVLYLTFKDDTTAKFTFIGLIWDGDICALYEVLWTDLKIERITEYSGSRKNK